MDINKEFVKYEQALALEKLRFDIPCIGSYTNKQKFNLTTGGLIYKITPSSVIIAPTYSQAFRWFREKHNFHHYIEPIHRDGKIKYEWCVVTSSEDDKEFEEDNISNSYEEAEEECLNKLIEILKK